MKPTKPMNFNTMTVALSQKDFNSLKESGFCTWEALVKRCPIYTPNGGCQVDAVKIGSVVVRGQTYAPGVRFGDGLTFRGAKADCTIKCKPSQKNVFNAGGWKNLACNEGSGHAFSTKVYNGGTVSHGTTGTTVTNAASEISSDTAFEWEGELVAVTIAFRLQDELVHYPAD